MDIIDIPASTSTYSSGRGGKPIGWIVIHYTGASGTARNNGTYFSGGDRNASA
ncbi:MAG: N-acetylmuramoyl-L-alanine amidase, partial [Atopobium sp.]|nr:N-acetylmuramoyl-L-alanine amidase [Atopobium sp.]